MSDFAKNQLLKFGWKEGKGLGKDENGITKPVKVARKSGVEGLGYKETFDAWWEKQYNSAVQNIQVESSQDGVTLSTINDNRDFSKKENKPKMDAADNANFPRTSVLHDSRTTRGNSGTLEEKKEFVDVPIIKKSHVISNNETKLNMTEPPCTSSAKLKRIELQNQLLGASDLYHTMMCPSYLWTLEPLTTKRLLSSEFSMSLRYNSKTKSEDTMTNRTNRASNEEKEEENETNNNTILQVARSVNIQSKSKNRKFKKRMNNLMRKLNNCSLKETDKKSEEDVLKDQVLRNVKNRRKECFKIKKKHECTRLIQRKEFAPGYYALGCGEDDDLFLKEESCAPLESLVGGSTSTTTFEARLGTSQHADTDTSDKNNKNSLYFHKCKRKHKNKIKKRQRSKIEEVIKNISDKRDIDLVAKALKEIDLTEDVSSTLKKKPTQNHITPV